MIQRVSYLLIQFEKATCSSSRTECVVPSADVFDVPPIVLSPGAARIICVSFEPKSLSSISSVYNWTQSTVMCKSNSSEVTPHQPNRAVITHNNHTQENREMYKRSGANAEQSTWLSCMKSIVSLIPKIMNQKVQLSVKNAEMCMWVGKPPQYVASHPSQIGLPSLRSRLIGVGYSSPTPAFLAGVRRGAFICVGWQVTLYDPI